MRALTAGTNIDAPSTDYPNGRARDLNGGPGTIPNEILFGDLLQLMQKLIIDAGITPNGLPDNVTNGYELLTALSQHIRTVLATTTLNGTVINGTANDIIAKVSAKNINTDNFRSVPVVLGGFQNGYSQGSLYGRLKYRRNYALNTVHIYGSVNVGTQQAVFLTLTSPLRPLGTDRKYFTVHGNDSSTYTMEITDAGEMRFRDNVNSIVLIDIIYNIEDES